jgi:hypothetical protein
MYIFMKKKTITSKLSKNSIHERKAKKKKQH